MGEPSRRDVVCFALAAAFAVAVDIARAALARRLAELSAAEPDLSLTEIRAPIDGGAGRPRVTPGAFVKAEAGPALGEIVSRDPVLIADRAPHAVRLDAIARARAADPAASFAQLGTWASCSTPDATLAPGLKVRVGSAVTGGTAP